MSHFRKAYCVRCGHASTCMYVAQFTDAIAITYANSRGIFGRGAGPIFLHNVDCRGNETKLDDCSHRRIGIHYCSHWNDAGVICSQGMLCMCVYSFKYTHCSHNYSKQLPHSVTYIIRKFLYTNAII